LLEGTDHRAVDGPEEERSVRIGNPAVGERDGRRGSRGRSPPTIRRRPARWKRSLRRLPPTGRALEADGAGLALRFGQATAKLQDRLGVDLADAALGDAEDAADLREREALVVGSSRG
jgi:hypothetical protein